MDDVEASRVAALLFARAKGQVDDPDATIREFEAGIRREERNRLLNPSDELVEAVTAALERLGQPPWEGDEYKDLARAALQAAGQHQMIP